MRAARILAGQFCLVAFWGGFVGAEETVSRQVITKTTAAEAYARGFAYDVLRTADDAGVRLNDLVLVENDAPGAGYSQKGTWFEPIHRGVLARKTLSLDNASARQAHVVLFLEPPADRRKQRPYYLIVNGHRIEGNPIPWHEGVWHWVRVPAAWLKPGRNEILAGCDADKEEGYRLLLAREDEYEAGGGENTLDGNTALVCADQAKESNWAKEGGLQRIDVGKHSARSTDGGRTWREGSLGETNDVLGEYTIRLNLERYKPRGRLQSAPIDLWGGLPQCEVLTPRCVVEDLQCETSGETPPGTRIAWSVRFADTPDMTSGQWQAFRPFSAKPPGPFQLDAAGRRYLQWQAELQTDDPLSTPVARGVTIRRRLRFRPPPADTYYVRRLQNVEHRYSSYRYAYEDCRHPQLQSLRKRLELDRVLEGTRGDFERINRLRHFVSQLWYHKQPITEFPEWNAHAILDRNRRLGAGGMCTQFSIVFFQCLQSLGYHARHVNIFAHETVEAYVDELGKWVHIDPESVFDSYEFNTRTGEPVNVLEQHRHFLDRFGFSAENPIDWMATTGWAWRTEGLQEKPQPLHYSTFTGWINDPDKPPPQHRLAGFMRMIPRNDFLSRPSPRPVNQGLELQWPWNGYVNWFDKATPRKLQYALHSDREADFYPTLNRVQFSTVLGEREGELMVEMFTFAPNFDGFQIKVDGAGWRRSPARFVWSLRPSAVNTLQMRAANRGGPRGKPSLIQVLWHYREPFQPKKPLGQGPTRESPAARRPAEGRMGEGS